MHDEISIELQIANRKYPLRIQESESVAVLKAAELINGKLKELEKTYSVRDLQDLFAMSALQIATQLIDLEQKSNGFYEQINTKFSYLETLIDEALPQT